MKKVVERVSDIEQRRLDKEYVLAMLKNIEGLSGVGITSTGVKVNWVDPDAPPRTILIEMMIMSDHPQAY